MSTAATLGLALLIVVGLVGVLLGVVGVLRLRAQRREAPAVAPARPASAPPRSVVTAPVVAAPVVVAPDPARPPAAPAPVVLPALGPRPPLLRPDPPTTAAPLPRPTPAALAAELRPLLAAGRKIEAIKRAREATGLGLKEAKDWVEGLEAGGPVELVEPAAPPARDIGGLEAELGAFLAAGRKIEAIKRAREATGLGLKEAKELVDRLEEGLPRAPPVAAPHAALEAELRALLAQDRVPEAILLLHRRLGLGISDAKAAVEALRAGATLAALGR